MSEQEKAPDNNKVIDVVVTIRCKVTVTDDFRENVPKYVDDEMTTDEQIAEGIVYASFWHRPELWQHENTNEDDYWDGAGNMKGLINGIEFEVEAD